MSIQGDAETNEKSMAELLVIVVVIGILMASFIQYFFSNENQIAETGFKALANNFASQVQAVHAQWQMDGRPENVRLKELSGVSRLTSVNRNGWVTGDTCHDIWQYVMDMPLTFLQQPISVLEIINTNAAETSICRYAISEKVFFDYHLSTGKVMSK